MVHFTHFVRSSTALVSFLSVCIGSTAQVMALGSDDEGNNSHSDMHVSLPSTSQSTLDQTIDFKKSGASSFSSHFKQVTGLSGAEVLHRWSDGPEVKLTFSRPLPANFDLIFTGFAFGPNIGKSIQVSFGSQETTFSLGARQPAPITQTIPMSALGTDDTLTFRIPSPAQVVRNNQVIDPRYLGVAFQEIQIRDRTAVQPASNANPSKFGELKPENPPVSVAQPLPRVEDIISSINKRHNKAQLRPNQITHLQSCYVEANGSREKFVEIACKGGTLLGGHKHSLKTVLGHSDKPDSAFKAPSSRKSAAQVLYDEGDPQVLQQMRQTDFRPYFLRSGGIAKQEQNRLEMKEAYRLISRQNHQICTQGYKTAKGTVVTPKDLGLTHSLKGTKRYSNPSYAQALTQPPKDLTMDVTPPTQMRVEVVNEQTNAGVLALQKAGAQHVAYLDLANRNHKAGGYINGALAQEEHQCRTTTLYPALDAQQYPFGHNEAFFVPDTKIFRHGSEQHFALMDQPLTTSVIVSAAYNLGGSENETLPSTFFWGTYQKVQQILDIALEQKVDGLVLSALGCGAFQNDPQLVASIFGYLLSHDYKDKFKFVRFSILSNKQGADHLLSNSNDQIFLDVMKKFNLVQ